MTVTAATTIATTAIPMPTATATATATPVPSPTPMVASPPPLASERYYEPEALRLYAQYIRDHYVQPAIDVPVREAIMAAEELNFILIPIPNEFQQRVSFVPHPAGEMKVVFVPDSSESLLALIEDPTWFSALTSGYAGSSGKTLGWFEFKELAVGEIVVTYLVYRARPEPDRLAFSPTDILYASHGYRGLFFVGPIE